MSQLLISEDELMATQARVDHSGSAIPDFSVRSLDEYSSRDLLTLLMAIAIPYEQAKQKYKATGDIEYRRTQNTLDIWGYRIKDAAKEASKRENGL